MPDLKALGAALARFRVQAGFETQDAAAKATGIERATIVRHEQGTGGVPHARTLGTYSRHYTLDAGLLRKIMDGQSPNVSESVPAGTTLPQTIRERIKEVELDLVRMGIDDDLVAGFGQSVRANPGLTSLFFGGAPTKTTAEESMQLFEAFVANYTNIVRIAMQRRMAEPGRE